jgi:hypothetical protein
MGSAQPFSIGTVKALYPTEKVYIDCLETAIAAATDAGFLLTRDADRLRDEAPARYRTAVAQ